MCWSRILSRYFMAAVIRSEMLNSVDKCLCVVLRKFLNQCEANSFLGFLSTVIGKLRLNTLNLSITSTYSRLKNHTKRIDLSCSFRVTCHFKMLSCLLNSQSSNCETRTFWIFKFAELVCEKSLTLMASCGRAANVIEKKLSPVAKLQILPLELLCEYLISISVLVFFLLDCDPHHSASIDTESENKYTC